LFERVAQESVERHERKGTDLAEVLTFTASPVIFYILVGSSVMRGTQRIGVQYLMAVRRQRLCAGIFVAEGVLNLFLSIILTRQFGLVGCAVGTLVPAVLFQGIVQPFCIHRLMAISLKEYVIGTLMRPVLTALVVALLVGALRFAAPIGAWGLWLAAALGSP